jgi:hypothetical protein
LFEDDKLSAATYAQGRRPWRTYCSRSFPLGIANSRDVGQWARYVYKVFDDYGESNERDESSADVERWEASMPITPGGRRQLKFQVAREAGAVRQIDIDEVVVSGNREPSMKRVLRLNRDASRRFLDLVETIKHVPVEGGEHTTRIDDSTIRDVLSDPESLARLYAQDPARFRALIQTDASARDVEAVAHRRAMIGQFRRLLQDRDYFERVQGDTGPEKVWQRFLEANPWILGVSLAGPLLTSWDEHKLEQVVAGASVSGPGKRVDALMETTGRIRALVFAEIKHHNTQLLESDYYRSGCWAPTKALSGAVAQGQRTVDIALDAIGERLRRLDDNGGEAGEATHFVRPRSFLIVGQLDQLRDGSDVHVAKYRSFELYRRSLHEPEIITYDELLARAEWHVAGAGS